MGENFSKASKHTSELIGEVNGAITALSIAIADVTNASNSNSDTMSGITKSSKTVGEFSKQSTDVAHLLNSDVNKFKV